MTACCGKPVKDSGPPGVAATRRVIGGLFCVSDRVEIVCLWAGELSFGRAGSGPLGTNPSAAVLIAPCVGPAPLGSPSAHRAAFVGDGHASGFVPDPVRRSSAVSESRPALVAGSFVHPAPSSGFGVPIASSGSWTQVPHLGLQVVDITSDARQEGTHGVSGLEQRPAVRTRGCQRLPGTRRPARPLLESPRCWPAPSWSPRRRPKGHSR